MTIYSPLFCPDDNIRNASDMMKLLGDVLRLFRRRVYISRLMDLYLSKVWLEEMFDYDPSVLRIVGEVVSAQQNSPLPIPVALPAKFVLSEKSTVVQVLAREFGNSIAHDLRGINGPLPDYAIAEIRTKLDTLEYAAKQLVAA